MARLTITIGELMNVDPDRSYKAQYCNVELVKTYHEIRQESLLEKIKSFFLGRSIVNGYYIIFKLRVTSDTGKKHTVIIRTDPDFNGYNPMANRIQVFCDCQDFKFRSAYILNSKKGLFLNDRTKLELGEALTNKPKKLAPSYLCKHAYSAIQWLISNYNSLMSTI